MSNINTTITSLNDVSARPDITVAPGSPTYSQLILLGLGLISSTTIKPKPVANASQCLYHMHIVELLEFPVDPLKGCAGMDRYLKEESGQQGAVYLRPDNDVVSLHKGCTCGEGTDKVTSKL